MRQNQNSRRSRGRGGRKPGSSRNQIFDSNGPGARVRGNSAQIYEKYQQLARDASSSGDRVAAENYFQHAEHYYRLMEAAGLARSGNGQDDAAGRDDNAIKVAETGGANPPEPQAPAAAPANNPAEQPLDGQPNAAAKSANGADGDGESKPARRTRARRANGAANGRGEHAGAAAAESGDDEAEASGDDPNPAVA